MRKIVLERFGGPEVLVARDAPEPEPPADGYVVQVRAAALNFADVVERRGRYGKDQRLPFEIGKEAAGVVVARGPEARGLAVGDTACVVKLSGGCYAERVAAGPDEIVAPPAGFSFEELSAFPIAFATAWYALREIARVRASESVLIQAAAGGVGSAAIALSRSLGCAPVLGAAGGAEKRAWVEAHGADACLDYGADDFQEALLEHTSGRGVDFVLESVGGDVLDRSLEALAPLGRLVLIGFSSIEGDYAERIRRLHPLTLFHRSITVSGLNVHNLDFPTRRDTWRRLVAHVEEHDLRPAIGHRFPLEEAATAHAALESRATRGKVLLLP